MSIGKNINPRAILGLLAVLVLVLVPTCMFLAGGDPAPF